MTETLITQQVAITAFHEEGREAFHLYHTLADNPYNDITQGMAFLYWRQGWQDARDRTLRSL